MSLKIIEAKLKALQVELGRLQSTCKHHNAQPVPLTRTGIHDASNPTQWYEFCCHECGKRWRDLNARGTVNESKALQGTVRINEIGDRLDDFVATMAFVHIEQMDSEYLWIGLNNSVVDDLHIDITSKSPIIARIRR